MAVLCDSGSQRLSTLLSQTCEHIIIGFNELSHVGSSRGKGPWEGYNREVVVIYCLALFLVGFNIGSKASLPILRYGTVCSIPMHTYW